MAKEPKQKSVLYIESQPFRLPGRVPSVFTSEQWRRTASEPTNQAYQGHLSRALKLEYKFVAKKGEDPKSTKVKEVIKYYEELFEKCYWDLTKVAWEKDSYDLPFGGSLEIGWWPDNAFGGKFPAGYPAWFVHVDAGTMWVNIGNPKYPYAQIDPNNNQNAIAFERREIARLMYLPHTSLALRGYQKSPTEQNYSVIGALSRLYIYDLKSLSDTPIAGILDLMDFSEADAVDWAKGFKEMMMGIEVIKIPILYEHEKPAQFVPFGQPVVDVKEKWKHYAEKCGNPYGLTIGSLGLYEHDRTLAGARIQRITTQRTGVGGYAYDEKRTINRQLFPPGCPIHFEWDVPEIEDVLKREQARGTRTAYMGVAVDKGALAPEDMLEQMIEDGIFTIPVKPGAIEPGIAGVPKPPPQQSKPTGEPKPQGKYPEYPPAMKAAHVVEETLLLKRDVGDDLEQTEAYELMQEVLAGQLYGKKAKNSIANLFGGLEESKVEKGGPGSGHWGHRGRKGKRGGSASSRAGARPQFRQVDVSKKFPGGYGSGLGGGLKTQPPPVRAKTGDSPPTDSQLKTIDKESFSPQEQKYIAEATRNLPQEHLDLVREINQDDLGSNLGGECGTYREITMNKHKGVIMYDSGTVVHEVAHAVMYAEGRSPGKEGTHSTNFHKMYYKRLGEVEKLEKLPLRAQAAAMLGRGGKKQFPTAYAKENHEELFAESYMLYVKSPASLQQSSPDIYTYMRDSVFGGIEY